MNRGFLIVLIPAILVAIGYMVVFHFIGVVPAYGRIVVAGLVFFGGIWWLGRRAKKKAAAEAR